MAAALAGLIQIVEADAAQSPNLLLNGDAEVHRCTDDWSAQTPVPGWHVLRGAASVLCYAAFRTPGEAPVFPKDGSHGTAFFSALGEDTAMEQTVDVSAAAKGIDAGHVSFGISAWLGGWRDRSERATITLVFLDAAGYATGDPVVLDGPGPRERGFVTGFVARQGGGAVPQRTRAIVATVSFASGLTSYQNAYADNLSLVLKGEIGALGPAKLVPPASTVPLLDHVFVLMMENTNYPDLIHTDGRRVTIDSRLPYLASIAKAGVTLTNTWGTYHPSDQNYVAMVAGDTYRYGPLYYPDYDLKVSHIGDVIDARHKTWRGYVQNMKKACDLGDHGWYAPDDQPFPQFHDVIAEPARCARDIEPLEVLWSDAAQGRLPNFAWIAADGWWDGEGAWSTHDSSMGFSLEKQDQFLKEALQPVLSSEGWRKSRSLLVITWDESLGWGWPDNHVLTMLVGSPGLLKAGATIDRHYDGYSVLRTSEEALGLPGLGRFDTYAEPMNAVFAGAAPPGSDLWAADSATTRGQLDDVFGRVNVPAAVPAGQPVVLVEPRNVRPDLFVNIEPLGRAPTFSSPRYSFDPQTGKAIVPTNGLATGFYGAWLRYGDEPAHHAPRALQILPPPYVAPEAPGVEIVGAPDGGRTKQLEIREVSNFIVRYCRPAGVAAADSWIGVFKAGTPPNKMTKHNAWGMVLRAPDGAAGGSCGDAWTYSAELPPDTDFDVFLMRERDGTSKAVGSHAGFRSVRALPK